jgi:hypothetical protein
MNRSEPDPIDSSAFERELQRQPLRPIPPEWRAEILAAAAGPSPGIPARPRTAPGVRLAEALRSLLWPSPTAWAGLAAAWVLIFGLNHAAMRAGSATALALGMPSPQTVAAMLERRRQVESLLEPSSALPAETPEPGQRPPGPRGALPHRRFAVEWV